MRSVVHSYCILLLVAAACGGGGDSSTGGVTPPGGGNNNPGTPVATNAVTVSDNVFSPSSVTVAPGTTVRWTWSAESREHNVRFPDGTGSEILSANATFSRAFPTAGTFTYQCTLHVGMTGTVTVR